VYRPAVAAVRQKKEETIMPAFLNPFAGNIPDKPMTSSELVRALRLDLAGELEATATYNAHADACDDPVVKKVLESIANEERVHVGELQRLMQYLAGDEQGFLDKGKKETDDIAKTFEPKEESKEEEPKAE
jgi:rubrerythrin